MGDLFFTLAFWIGLVSGLLLCFLPTILIFGVILSAVCRALTSPKPEGNDEARELPEVNPVQRVEPASAYGHAGAGFAMAEELEASAARARASGAWADAGEPLGAPPRALKKPCIPCQKLRDFFTRSGPPV